MNKSSNEILLQLVEVAAGLYDEANQQLDDKKQEYAEHLKRQTQTTAAAHDKLQKLQTEYAEYQKTENPDTKRLNKLKSDVAEAEKSYLRLDGLLYSTKKRNFDDPDIVKAAKEKIRSNLIEAHHETMRDPLLKNDPVILDDIHMEELVRLSEVKGGDNAEKAAFIRFLVVEAVGTCLQDRIESRNNLLADYQLYQTEGGFSQELYLSLDVLNEKGEKNPGFHHGVSTHNGADEYDASSNKNQKHQSNLREVANKFGIVDATIEQEIASSQLSSAADRMYSRLSVHWEAVNVGGEVTQLMWADRVFQACQIKQAAEILFPTLDVKRGLTFDNVLENFNDKRLSEDLNESTYKGCVVKHAIQLNDFRHRLDFPSNLKFGAASLPGGDRTVIENGNGIRVLMNVSDQLLKQIGILQNKDEKSAVILLNLLSQAYSSSTMNSPREFFSSPEILGAIQQLVAIDPRVMQDREFIDALASHNRMAEHFGVSPLNLGEKNNAIINAHVVPLNIDNKIVLRGLSKDLGTHFDFQSSDEAGQNINVMFNGWVRSPAIFADLKNPELMTRGSEIPSVIEFKDGAKIIRDGDDLVLSGFSPEKMKSFQQAVLLKEFKGDPEIVSTDPKFHQQVAAEFSVAQLRVLKRRESQIIEQRLSKRLKSESQLELSTDLPTLKSRGTVLQSKRKETGAVPKAQENLEEQKRTAKGDKQVSFSDSMDDTMSAGSSKVNPRGFSSGDSSEEVSPRKESAVRGKITPRGGGSNESVEQKSEAGQSFLGTAWNAFLKYTNIGALISAASEAWNRTGVSKLSRSEQAKAASREKIQHADPATLSAAKGIFENAEKKYSNRQFDYYEFASTRTPWAIMNFMSHSVFKENVSTEFDNAIVQVMLNQKSSEPEFNQRIIQVMALRNAIAEQERLDPKTPSVEIAIEEMKLKLDRSISEIESLQGEMKMTDTTRASRNDASTESLSTLNLGDVGDKAGLVDGGSSDAELSGESPREGEALLGGKKAEEPVSLFGRLRQAVAGLFGAGGKAEAKTGVEAAGTKVGEYEYNQVLLNGYAKNFEGNEEGFNAWLNSQKGLEISKGGFGNFPIEFKGGQRIELSGDGKDVVMKGFSAAAYESFGENMFTLSKPSIRVSSTSPSSIKDIASKIKVENSPTFTSVLTSVRLLFQQVGSTVKSFFTGPSVTTSQTAKSEPSVAKTGEMSRVSVENSEVARTPKPAPVPTATASVVVDQKRSSLPPTPVSVEPKIERRQISSAPAKGIPSWVSRVKVTVASDNDLQTTQSAVTNYANTHGFRDVQVEQKPRSLSMQLEDNKGGRLSISAEQGRSVVEIEEVKRSDDTPNHIANIATDLPNKGPKDVTVNGRESMKEKVQTALTTVGDHKITTAADKENVSHVANLPAPPR